MLPVPDLQLIDRLRIEDDAAFKLLYSFYFPGISTYVLKNSGTSEDAEDIFQETIIVLLHKVRQPGFQLTSSLQSYLFIISRNLWLKKLRDQKLLISADGHLMEGMQDTNANAPEFSNEITREEQVQQWLQKIPGHCRWIIKALFYSKESMSNLIKRMGWKNKHTAANQKYKCIQQVKKASGAG